MRRTSPISCPSGPWAEAVVTDMALRVVHRTEYAYDSAVSASYGPLYVLPRDGHGQSVLSTRVDIDPRPDSYNEFVDFFGNRVANFSILRRHRSLVVTTNSIVDVSARRPPDLFSGSVPWDQRMTWLDAGSDQAAFEDRQFILASPAVPASAATRAYAEASFPAGRPLLEALADLNTRIHQDIRYQPGTTSLVTTPDEVLAERKGVCQDFAHLAVGCLRSMGVPARYVSGYLETLPPPGKAKLQGADASHAWLSAHVPGIGWVDVDPTNNCFVGERHITTAWGRDYSDVSPLKGVIFTEAKSNTMTVSVDVSPAA